MKKVIYLMMAIVCVSCTTIGTKFDLSDLDGLVPGQTTLQEVSELLGPPVAASAMDNGAMLYEWHYVRTRFGGASTSFATISFDDRKIMIRVEHQAAKNMSML